MCGILLSEISTKKIEYNPRMLLGHFLALGKLNFYSWMPIFAPIYS
jgi:hypothetical protein